MIYTRYLALIAFISLLYPNSNSNLELRNKKILQKKSIITTEPGEIIELMKSSFISFEFYSASFKELSYLGLKSGTIKYKKPHYLSVKYLNKNGESRMDIYVNQQKLYVYLKDLNLVAEQDLLLEDPQNSQTYQIIDTINLDRLVQIYNFNFLESKRPVPVLKKKEAERFRVAPTDKITAYHFILTPKDKTRGVSHMELWVSKKGSIIRAKCYTMENKLIDFLFYNIKLNQSIADKEFQFVIPPSAQVLKNSFMQSP